VKEETKIKLGRCQAHRRYGALREEGGGSRGRNRGHSDGESIVDGGAMLKRLVVSAEQKRMTKEADRKVEERVAIETRLWADSAKKHGIPTKKQNAP